MTEAEAPPSGGLGAHDAEPSSLPFGPTPAPFGPASLLRRLVVLLGVVLIVGIAGGYSVRLYVDRAKSAEARVSLRKITRLAQQRYTETGSLCQSARAAVPAEMPPSRKYTARSHEWEADADIKAGFACLGFEGPMIMYFQYTYEATPTGFVATARGQVHDDNRVTTLRATGEIRDGLLYITQPAPPPR